MRNQITAIPLVVMFMGTASADVAVFIDYDSNGSGSFQARLDEATPTGVDDFDPSEVATIKFTVNPW